jgi:hypothetical protein
MSLASMFVAKSAASSTARSSGSDAWTDSAGADSEARIEKRRRVESSIMHEPAQQEDKFSECIVVLVDSAAHDDLRYDVEHRDALGALKGRWWLVRKIDGSPVFKQEPPIDDTQLNRNELYLWRNDRLANKAHRGWYVTRTLGDDSFHDPDNRVAWCNGRAGEPQTFPASMHYPFWSSSEEPSIRVLAYTDWLQTFAENLSEKTAKFEDTQHCKLF